MKRYIYIFIVLGINFSCEEAPPPVVREDLEVDVSACLDDMEDDKLDIVTWNIQEFPLLSVTPQYIDDIIKQMDADVIAIQEIASVLALDGVIGRIQSEGWQGKLHGLGAYKLGFLYNSNKVDISNIVDLFSDDPDVFPRPVLKTIITCKPEVFGSEEEVVLFNVHLKCCDGNENLTKRRNAMSRIKSYVDGVHPGDKVVITGDFNDVLDASEDLNIFNLFVNDTPNYNIADMEVATGNNALWSYPSYPSHLDHFIISDELFGKVKKVKTILLEDCIPDYDEKISDHRPVMLTLDF